MHARRRPQQRTWHATCAHGQRSSQRLGGLGCRRRSSRSRRCRKEGGREWRKGGVTYPVGGAKARQRPHRSALRTHGQARRAVWQPAKQACTHKTTMKGYAPAAAMPPFTIAGVTTPLPPLPPPRPPNTPPSARPGRASAGPAVVVSSRQVGQHPRLARAGREAAAELLQLHPNRAGPHTSGLATPAVLWPVAVFYEPALTCPEHQQEEERGERATRTFHHRIVVQLSPLDRCRPSQTRTCQGIAVRGC